MEVDEAHERRDEVQLLDVREQHEWNAGHIEGAVHIPMGQLSARQHELADDRLIVCVCRSGQRSAAVTRALNDAGYEAANLEGGMQVWQHHGYDVVVDDGSEGTVI